MTNLKESLQSLAVEIMSSPKTTGAVAGSSAALGTVAAMDLIRGTLAMFAVAAGVLASLALARYHLANERNMRLKNKMLEQQLRDAGIDPNAE